jgi:hypothetical protein
MLNRYHRKFEQIQKYQMSTHDLFNFGNLLLNFRH